MQVVQGKSKQTICVRCSLSQTNWTRQQQSNIFPLQTTIWRDTSRSSLQSLTQSCVSRRNLPSLISCQATYYLVTCMRPWKHRVWICDYRFGGSNSFLHASFAQNHGHMQKNLQPFRVQQLPITIWKFNGTVLQQWQSISFRSWFHQSRIPCWHWCIWKQED